MNDGSSLSVRIVTADYYLSAPIPELDISFSEFRGCEVKQLPVLRIFGATPQGAKTCVHIHGVFPYLYIPCNEPKPEPKTAYQIANSIDKAINISLKQAHSNTQHVYKVTLVQGIPFYGFHTKPHQFYKIFFYNPVFVKRAADLLQHGAILGLSFQPHESHINFPMQFFLDFNLYGMSFINMQNVKLRRKNCEGKNLSQSLSLDSNDLYLPDIVKYTSRCEYEVDCLAQDILNRKDVINGNLGANPGLEALWEDEKARRENLDLSENLMPTQSQVRNDAPVTDSHLHYAQRLLIKLTLNSETNENSETNFTLSLLNDTISTESPLEKSQPNSEIKNIDNKHIYPAETPTNSQAHHATNVMMHHPSHTSKKGLALEESNFIVDETVVLEYSQSQSTSDIDLDCEDLEFMELLRGMEDKVEDDSILGSQACVVRDVDEENPPEEHDDHQDSLEHDNTLFSNLDVPQDAFRENFSPCESPDSSQSSSVWNDTFWDNVENISQLDGAWDELLPNEKRCKRKIKVGLSKPVRQSAKNTKPVILRTPPKVGTLLKTLNLSPKCSIINSKIETFQNNLQCSPKKSPRNVCKNVHPLKTFHISPPFREKSSPNKSNRSPIPKLKIVRSKYGDNIAQTLSNQTELNEIAPVSVKDCDEISYSSCLTNKVSTSKDEILSCSYESIEKLKQTEPLLMDQTQDKECNKNLMASQYDRLNMFIPLPGSSTKSNILNDKTYVEDNDDNNVIIADTGDTLPLSNEQILSSDDSFVENSNSKPDLGIISFYDTTIYHDKSVLGDVCKNEESQDIVLHYDTSPERCEDARSIVVGSQKSNVCKSLNVEDRRVVLTPAASPPSCAYIKATLDQYNIPHQLNEQPCYSNHKDVGHQIEVGQIVLKLRSKKLADLKPFESSIKDLVTIDKWREDIFMKNSMSQMDNIKDLKSFLASNRKCVLTPALSPPTRQSVVDWLRKKESKESEDNSEYLCKKSTYCIPVSPGQDMNDSQQDILSISPFSPLTCNSDSNSLTPASVQKENTPSVKSAIRNKSKSMRKLRPRSLHSSLSQSICDFPSPKGTQCSNDSVEILSCEQDPSSSEDKLGAFPDRHFIDKEKLRKSVNLSTTLGFKFSGENYQNAVAVHEHEYLTILVLEVLTSTRGDVIPDPEKDALMAVFYCVIIDCPKDYPLPSQESGIIFIKDNKFKHVHNGNSCFEGLNEKHRLTVVEDEASIIKETLNLIWKWDPDILCGYEVEMFSWGYFVQRGCILEINMSSELSRVPQERKTSWKNSSQEIVNKEVKVVGRIMLDFWRLMRHEIALTSYSFENVMYHIMHERIPKFSYKTLYFWWNHPSGLLRTLSMEYYLTRVIGVINIMRHLDLIGRTSELARLFGIQWYEVLSRGSQFRVESMMIRMTRPRNYVLVSPSVQQRAAMKAPECIPLVMEPESRFYNDPVIVLDFQSLYPSMMIAYNYCYSTCIGKVNNMGRDAPYEFGCTHLKLSPKMLKRLHKKNLINWSPCGVGFVKKEVRCGVLPTMLQDILGTRLMVKKAMKKHREDKTLQKILHSRQLGLKLIANVTYGYTAANFSGRMPCIEVGDSVVSKGRETLEQAIRLVESTPKWRARVVYGDTDSIFVMVPGRSRSEAFDIGAEIAEAVTNNNPTPVKLKLEKVYQPCILQTKKRYVGYMYESKEQKTPTYDAKGIETVRRDGCPATAKILEKTLRILFDTLDVSRVKTYICKEFQKILEGQCNIKDFIFAKEFRGINNYKTGAAIPALEIVRQAKLVDPRSEPRESERVPYVMVCGAPGESLMRLARPPLALLTNPSLQLYYSYYISRQIIPPLNRCLTLLGADVNQWFAELPRKQYQFYPRLNEQRKETEGKKSTISQYFSKTNCPGCETLTNNGLCDECMQQPQRTMVRLHTRVNSWQRRHNLLKKVCQSCCGRSTNMGCVSIDCPVLFTRAVAQRHIQQVPYIHKMMEKLTE